MGIAEDFILIIVAGFAAGLIASRLKLPPILGYIVAGIVIGPHTGGVTVTNLHDVELLAEIGVALLLFSIGLDFSIEELREVRNVSLMGGALQISLSIAYGLGIGRLFGFSWVPSFILGGILSLSSTMVGKSIGELRIRTATGASVVGIYRRGLVIANPGPDVTLSAGDIVAVIGTPESRRGFARLIATDGGRDVDEYEERQGGTK